MFGGVGKEGRRTAKCATEAEEEMEQRKMDVTENNEGRKTIRRRCDERKQVSEERKDDREEMQDRS